MHKPNGFTEKLLRLTQQFSSFNFCFELRPFLTAWFSDMPAVRDI